MHRLWLIVKKTIWTNKKLVNKIDEWIIYLVYARYAIALQTV